jgi:hypothetical protein
LKDIWKNAKLNNEVLHFKNFQTPEISWEDALTFVYNLSKIPSPDLIKKYRNWGDDSKTFGSVLMYNGYFMFENTELFSKFKGVTEFMEKVNGGNSGKDCSFYTIPGTCNCEEQWHIQALRLSISDYSVSTHKDPNNVLYWQLLGNSYWIIDEDKEYKLEPGDLFYFNKENFHEVRQDGPRAGIIIDDIHSRASQ